MTVDPELIERLVRDAKDMVDMLNDDSPVPISRVSVCLATMADQIEAARREVDAWRRKAEVALKLFDDAQDDAKLMRTVIAAADAWRDFPGDDDTAESNDLEAAIDAYRAAKGNRP